MNITMMPWRAGVTRRLDMFVPRHLQQSRDSETFTTVRLDWVGRGFGLSSIELARRPLLDLGEVAQRRLALGPCRFGRCGPRSLWFGWGCLGRRQVGSVWWRRIVMSSVVTPPHLQRSSHCHPLYIYIYIYNYIIIRAATFENVGDLRIQGSFPGPLTNSNPTRSRSA